MGVIMMFKKGVVIEGSFFEKRLFNILLMKFKESFSHGSLTIEKAFTDYNDCCAKINSLLNEESLNIYRTKTGLEKLDIDNNINTMLVFFAHKLGYFSGPFDTSMTKGQIAEIVRNDFFELRNDSLKTIVFNDDKSFNGIETAKNICELFSAYFEKENSKKIAQNMKKDHLDAFDYAMTLQDITAKDIIDINAIIVQSDPDKEIGFKKTNNTIIGTNMKVTDKKMVPSEIQRLLADYEDDFGLGLEDFNDNTLSDEERDKRLFKFFQREAIFHIRFERIHPFKDGNGRCGRILMNKHLLDEGIAPVLFTKADGDKYRECIKNYDYNTLAYMMFSSSSQCFSNWCSWKKPYHLLLSNSNEELSKIYDNNEEEKNTNKVLNLKNTLSL